MTKNQNQKTPKIVPFLFLTLILFAAISWFYQAPKQKEVSLTEVILKINEGVVQKVTISDQKIKVVYENGEEVFTTKEQGTSFGSLLLGLGVNPEKLKEVEIEFQQEKGISLWLGPFILSILPIVLFFLFFFIIFRQAKTGAMQTFDFTQAKARLFGAGTKQKEKITFNDVAGLKEAKEELKEVVDFLKNPKKYLQIGAKIPRGVLLIGPPGCGKTLLARAIASEANVPFFSISGSEFIELFVGVGSSIPADTNVLTRIENSTKLVPIGEFVDQFFKENEEGLKNIENVQTLGVDFARGNKFFKSSNWKKVKAVYRHKVDKIYEIQFIGGKIKVTPDHSVFIRNWNHIIPKKVSELRVGDILVGLPFSVKGGYDSKLPLGKRSLHFAKAHKFPENLPFEEITIWSLEDENNNFGFHNSTFIPGSIAKILGLSNHTHHFEVSTLTPQRLKNLVYKIKITPPLMKLLGYYTAEGDYHARNFRFSFGAHEKIYHQDCVKLVKDIFGLKPYFRKTKNNALVIGFSSVPIGKFFANQCGQGAQNKHVPEFIWDLPKEYFVSYLDGLVKGDGWINKKKMIEFSSSSKQLISELRWLLNMHGVPCSVTKYIKVAGHRIKNGKPMPKSIYWRITVATRINPLSKNPSPLFFKRPIIKKITVKPYDNYVYDLCGCDGEAFFGGEKPILLHNSRIRSLFSQAKKVGRAIIFIDEIDSIGRTRGIGFGGGYEEREQTLNQLLAEMDGFERDDTRIVVAATNRPDVLDPALLRPGRFDRRVVLDLPDIKDREEILKIHARQKPLASDVNFREIAERTPGFSGADLENLMNEAAIFAAKTNKTKIFQKEFLESIEKVLLGPERRSHILSKKEKEIAAYHEAGHALTAVFTPGAEQIRKISIVARGLAAGYTLKMPREERKIKTKSEFLGEMAILLGGYCAEKLKFKEMTTGASNDLTRASDLARKLVKEYGMSSLGPTAWGEKEELAFLGVGSEQKNYSEKIAAEIDKEVAKFIKEAEKKAGSILKKKKGLLEKLAKTLIEKETIEKEEFERIIKKNKTE